MGTVMNPHLVDQREQEPAAVSVLDQILAQQSQVASRYKPVMSIAEMIERDEAIKYLVERVMKEGIDYGWIPGTRPKPSAPGEYQAKPTLFKAGAERACAFFGYAPKFEELESIEAWTPEEYGEMLFYYQYECTLSKDGAAVGSGIGSATTWESKYRYRKGERSCPECSASAIIKGRSEYGGGWVCYGKKGGCGAKFKDGDEAIEGQNTERIPNPDAPDVINTVQKMAQKRAYVAATLTATGLSGRFTQDIEDLPSNPEMREQVKERRLHEERTAEREQTDPRLEEVLEGVKTDEQGRNAVAEMGRQLGEQIGTDEAREQTRRVMERIRVSGIDPRTKEGSVIIIRELFKMVLATMAPEPESAHAK